LFSVALGLMCFATFSPSVRIFSPGPSAPLERAELQSLRIEKDPDAGGWPLVQFEACGHICTPVLIV
jgi:hypothetical protein